MKKYYLCLIILISSLNLYAGKENVLHIVGKLKDAGSSLIITQYVNMQLVRRDSFPVNNGKVDIKLKMEKPRKLLIFGTNDKNVKNAKSSYISIVGVPGETLKLIGNADEYTISGSKFYRQYEEMRNAVKPFEEELMALRQETDNMKANGMSQRDVLNKTRQINQRMAQVVISFARQHPDYEAAATFLSKVNFSQWDNYLSILTPAVREGRMRAYYQPLIDMFRDIDRQEKEKNKVQEEFKKKLVVGSVAPDFTLMDINGTPLTLSSLRGKYVVLDFWGSWCSPCVKGLPEMKKYHEQYKDKFEILGIDCNDSEDKWKKTVADYALPWLHVYNKNDNNDVKNIFGVYAFPTKIVIDPQGKIARSFVGESNDFYTYLDELLQ